MPHLLIERTRTCTNLVRPQAGQKDVEAERTPSCLDAFMVEAIDLLGAFIFLLGSVCILPGPQRTLEVFLLGCVMFMLGGFVYFGLHIFTFYESFLESGWSTEAVENALYVGGSFVFLVGTLLYWPEEAQHATHVWMKATGPPAEWMKRISIGNQLKLFTPEFEGALLFIAGSVLFGFAALVNGMNKKSTLLIATVRMYLIGSVLFVVGSVLFLPNLGYILGWEGCEAAGAWCFIIGSALYVLGGGINLVRAHHNKESQADEQTPLVGKSVSRCTPVPRSFNAA